MVLTKVLKEWSSALKFYENKKVCLIFRKGGIHEKDFIETKDFFGFFRTPRVFIVFGALTAWGPDGLGY